MMNCQSFHLSQSQGGSQDHHGLRMLEGFVAEAGNNVGEGLHAQKQPGLQVVGL